MSATLNERLLLTEVRYWPKADLYFGLIFDTRTSAIGESGRLTSRPGTADIDPVLLAKVPS